MTGVPSGPHRATQADDASVVAADVKGLIEAGRRDEAAERFGDLVTLWQRRAVRLACYYLGNAADADEAVQDAFVKVYAHMTSFRVDQPFDARFTFGSDHRPHLHALIQPIAHFAAGGHIGHLFSETMFGLAHGDGN